MAVPKKKKTISKRKIKFFSKKKKIIRKRLKKIKILKNFVNFISNNRI